MIMSSNTLRMIYMRLSGILVVMQPIMRRNWESLLINNSFKAVYSKLETCMIATTGEV